MELNNNTTAGIKAEYENITIQELDFEESKSFSKTINFPIFSGISLPGALHIGTKITFIIITIEHTINKVKPLFEDFS